MRRAAALSRQPSSSRGGWLAHQERGLLAAQRGSQADPTGFQPVCSSPGYSKRRLRGFCGLAPLLYWLLRTPVRETGLLGFHRPVLATWIICSKKRALASMITRIPWHGTQWRDNGNPFFSRESERKTPSDKHNFYDRMEGMVIATQEKAQ